MTVAQENSESVTTDLSASEVSDTSVQKRRLWVADLTLLAVAIIWGVNVPVMKAALQQGIDPYALNAIRLVISAMVLQSAAWWEYRSGIRPQSGIRVWRIFVYAMIVSVAYQLLFLLAVSKTSSADVALIMATVPMWTALTARVFLKESLARLAWLGLFIAFAGTMIVTLTKPAPQTMTGNSKPSTSATAPELGPRSVEQSVSADTRTERQSLTVISGTLNAVDGNLQTTESTREAQRSLGNMIALLAAVAWAGGTVFSRPLLKLISPTQLAACSATIGLPFHLLISGTATVASLSLLQQVPLQICIIYSGILSTGLALPMWSYGVKHAGAAQATMFQNLCPIVAIMTAWLWRNEPVSFEQCVGGALILSGLLVMRHSRLAGGR